MDASAHEELIAHAHEWHCSCGAELTLKQPTANAGCSLSPRQLERNRKAGLARARSWLARDSETGRFRSHAEAERIDQNYEAWLDERPGRRGGVERALTAKRLMGRFWFNDDYPSGRG